MAQRVAQIMKQLLHAMYYQKLIYFFILMRFRFIIDKHIKKNRTPQISPAQPTMLNKSQNKTHPIEYNKNNIRMQTKHI